MLVSRKISDTPDMYFEHTKEMYRKLHDITLPILDETTEEVFVSALSILFVAHLVDIHRDALEELGENTEEIVGAIRKNIDIARQQQRIINMVERANEEE